MILDDYLWTRLWHRWALLLGVVLIILYAIDFLAQIREYDHWAVLDVAKMVVYRLPILLDTALPYLGFLTVFFTFSGLQNANIFDVMRASRYSWRAIMRVSLVFAFLLGVFHAVVFDEIRFRAHGLYQDLLVAHGDYSENPLKGQDLWLKSDSPGEILFLQAKGIRDAALQEVTVVRLDPSYVFKGQIRAEKAVINGAVLTVKEGWFWSSGTANPLPPQGLALAWEGPSWEALSKPSPLGKTFLSTLQSLRGQAQPFFQSKPEDMRVLWQGAARPLYYSALAVLACVALLSSHHRTRSFVPFLVTVLVVFVLHLASNAMMHGAMQGFLPFWYAALWASVLLLFGSFLVLMRRTYGSV